MFVSALVAQKTTPQSKARQALYGTVVASLGNNEYKIVYKGGI